MRPAAVTGDVVIGVDIGGTFTDCAVIDETGRVHVGKVPTTPQDRSLGFFNAIDEVARGLGLTLGELLGRCHRLVHGTTTGTNAIVTRTGARVGLLTTAGHADVMYIMKGTGRTAGVPADELMDLVASRAKPAPIVPKNLIVEVPERIDRHGRVLAPLDRDTAVAKASELLALGVEAIAISLLWSVKNPAHELLLVDAVRELAPEIFLSCGSTLSATVGEYPRTSTAVMNAYIGPLMTHYVDAIEDGARRHGYRGNVLFSQCSGGAILAEEARRAPILTLNSGPVAGVMGSLQFAKEIREPSVLTTDMGGTTYDVSLIQHDTASLSDTARVEKFELSLPILDVESIGAGGGSIAWTDESNRLNVGPRSAGAEPGPACYGRGGQEPTVTDADVVLGFIDPDTFLHGEVRLDVEASERALAALGATVGLDIQQTAAGICRIVDAKMAGLLRRSSEFRGVDPRRLTMLAFGGAGPVHAAMCARQAGIRRVVVPPPAVAPVWSAAGAANADITNVYLESQLHLMPMDPELLHANFARISLTATKRLQDQGFSEDEIVVRQSVRMKYAVQVYDIEVPLEGPVCGADDVQRILDSFDEAYAQRFGHNAGFREGGVHVTGFQVVAFGTTNKRPLTGLARGAGAAFDESSRRVYWPDLGDWVRTPVLRTSGRWEAERVMGGPALVELPNTVIVVPAGMTATLRRDGAVAIE
ncbi:MAG: hydantoinase/oxoprolinase family protein [Candidatus Acidiferrum sp.]